jgi:hypothetical protein
MGLLKTRIHLERVLQSFHGIGESAREVQQAAVRGADDERQRIEFCGAGDLRQRIVMPSEGGQQQRVAVVPRSRDRG